MKIYIHQLSTGYYLPIMVNGKKIATTNPRVKDWPKHDSNPKNCKGYGHEKCMFDGRHNFFNHSMDSYYTNNLSNLPEGFVE